MAIKDVLIVDDDTLFCWGLRKELAKRRLRVAIAGNGRECIEAVKEKRFDMLFLDIHLPDANGLDLLETIRADSPGTRVVVVSADGTSGNKRAALSAGAEQFLEKPFDIDVLTRFVAKETREGNCRCEHPRYLCRFPLTLSVLSPLPGEEQFFLGCMRGTAEDIGYGGIRLTTEYPLRAGQRVRLKVADEEDPFSGMIPRDGHAVVVWAVSRGNTSTAGLRFLGPTPARTSSPGTSGNRR